jgi:hypothetical protein
MHARLLCAGLSFLLHVSGNFPGSLLSDIFKYAQRANVSAVEFKNVSFARFLGGVGLCPISFTPL